MRIQETNAAHDLNGKTLTTGWNVVQKIEKAQNATGGFFLYAIKYQRIVKFAF